MAPEQLLALLETITGHLHTTNETEEKNLQGVQEKIASSLVHQDVSTVSNQQFSIANSDLFFRQNIDKERREKLDEIVTKVLQEDSTGSLKYLCVMYASGPRRLPVAYLRGRRAPHPLKRLAPLPMPAGGLCGSIFIKLKN